MAIDWKYIFAIGDIDDSWLSCVVLSMIFDLAVYTVFLIVTKENAPSFTCNKLTMRPYYLILIYSAVFTV